MVQLLVLIGCEDKILEPNKIPTIRIIENPGLLVTSSEVTFSWEGDDEDGEILGYNYSLDNSEPNIWTTQASVTMNVNPGTHSFFIQSKDDDGAFSAVERFNFEYTPPSITIISPSAGRYWETGSSQSIQWSSAFVSAEVGISLYNDDVFYQTITSRTNNDGEYSWSIPMDLPLGMGYSIKIYDSLYPSTYSFSRYHFVIYSSESSLTLTFPNGGENLAIGTTPSIYWSSYNITHDLIIEVWKGGNYYLTIDDDADNDGHHFWEISDESYSEGDDYQVKIIDQGNVLTNDISDDMFSIYTAATNEIIVYSPDGNEEWPLGSTQDIIWNGTPISDLIKIELYKSGEYHSTIVPGSGAVGSYSWDIPMTLPVANDYMVKVSDLFYTSITDISNENFSLIENNSTITVLAPNGGESYPAFTGVTISWTSVNVGDFVKIDLYKSDEYVRTLDNRKENNGVKGWMIEENHEPGYDYSLKISDAANESIFDFSDNYFSITSRPDPQVTIISPNGGEDWQLGSTHEIIWSTVDTDETTEIKLYKGGDFIASLAGETANNGNYTWTIYDMLPEGDDYQIGVHTRGLFTAEDYSDRYFAISGAPQPNIAVLTPNGGEAWQIGSSQTIYWNSSLVTGNVSIKLLNNGTYSATLDQNAINDGVFEWQIPTYYTEGNYYQVQISSVDNQEINDVSDEYFALLPEPPPIITLVSPNGGETWMLGSNHQIIWNSLNTSNNVRIDLIRSDGSYENITSNLSNTNQYNWNLSSDLELATDYRISITDSYDVTITDVSDEHFAVSQEPELAYLEVVWGAGGFWIITNVENWSGGGWLIVYSELATYSNHPIEDPTWNQCGGEIQVLKPTGFDDSQHLYMNEHGYVGDYGIDIDPSCSSVTIQLEHTLEVYTGFGGFWASTDAEGCQPYPFNSTTTDCHVSEATINEADLLFESPLEINIGYDDTNILPLGDFDGGINRMKLIFNGWIIESPTTYSSELLYDFIELNGGGSAGE